MVKNVPRVLLSLFLIFFLSCSVSPTYYRKDIESIIKNICKKEFNIDINVWEIGDTIWIYVPFEKLLDGNNKLDKKVVENMRGIFLSLKRTILSMDRPPKFYVFVLSDIKEIGIDLYYMGFIPDMIKAEVNFISLQEMQEREIILYSLNPKALGDKHGEHLKQYEIKIEGFISYLIKQSLEKEFAYSEFKNNFHINDLQTDYRNGKLEVIIDIMIKKYKEGLPVPFEEAKKTVKKFLKIYEDFEDIREIEINDTFNKKLGFYTSETLLNRNFSNEKFRGDENEKK